MTTDAAHDAEGEAAPVDRTAPTEHERAGGSGREYALLLVIGGLLGAWSSVRLLLDHMALLADPDFVPTCDINPLIGCGMFLGSEQAHAFGFPNPVIGVVAYPVVIATGALLLGRARLPLWYWRGLLAGTLFGIGFVTWLQVQALTQIRALCPYCLVVWAVMIPIIVHTLARSMQNGALPAGDGVRSLLVGNRWIITAIWYLAVVAAAVLALGDAWLTVF